MPPERLGIRSGEDAMIWRWVSVVLKWVLALGLIGGLLVMTYWINGQMRAEQAREGEDEAIQAPLRTRDGVVELGVEESRRYGLKAAAAESAFWTERVPVYGQVVGNPKATAEVRSPFAGTLRADPGNAWPEPGQWIRAGQTVGWVDIRVGAQERLTLEDNLNNARLKKAGAEKIEALQRARVERIEKVSQSQIVPGQQLDDAKVLLAEAETQLGIASAAVELWQKALEEVDRPGRRETSTYSQPLKAPADGEVVDVAAKPGMAIEAGLMVAQVVDFRRPMVRLEIPPELMGSGPPERVRLMAIAERPPGLSRVAGSAASPSREPPGVEAVPVGPAPQVDAASQFVGYWYEPEAEGSVGPIYGEGDGPGTIWRPGLRVKTWLSPPGVRARPAVRVGSGAVLFHQGRALVYVRVKPGGFERREVQPLGRDGEFWVLAARQDFEPGGLKPGEVVVSHGAQVLLSEEFRGEVAADTD